MRDVGLEAGPHLLEGLVLVAEEGEGRLGAMFGGVGGMQQRILVAGPVEHDEIAAACREGVDRAGADQCRQRQGQGGEALTSWLKLPIAKAAARFRRNSSSLWRGPSDRVRAAADGPPGRAQYPALIFSNSAIIFSLSSDGSGDWNSVLSTNFSTSS